MVDRHLCQLTNELKAKVLTDLYNAVRRFQALEPKKVPLYKEEDLPIFLKKRLPKFKFNHELCPLISCCSTMEVRFTTNPKCVLHQDEDPNVVFAKIDGPQNPFKKDGELTDTLCENQCKHAAGTTPASPARQCPVHDLLQGVGGVPYECTGDEKCLGIMACQDPKSGQSYLCTRHVQQPK